MNSIPSSSPSIEVEVAETKPSWRETYLGLGDDRDTKNVSWGAIFAGVVTTAGLLVLFSLLGSAIGLGIIKPTSNQPFSGLGVGLLIWAVLSLLVSFGVGGYVTGALAGRAGFLHGIVSGAGGLIVVTVVATMTAGAALGAVGTLVAPTVSAIGSGAGAVGSAAGNALDGVTDAISDELSGVNGRDVSQQTEQILVGTGIPELQPGYLREQAKESTDDIAAAGRELLANPDNYDTILSDLGSSLANRANTISGSVDRDAIAKSVAANTDLTGAQAQQTVDNIADGIQSAANNARTAFNNADQAVDRVTTEVKTTIDRARQVAEDASNNIATAAGWGFAAGLLTLIVTAFAGLLGARSVAPKRVTTSHQGVTTAN